MTALTRFHGAWRSRPADETFESLYALGAAVKYFKESADEKLISSKQVMLRADPADLTEGLAVETEGGLVIPTHWSLGQLCGLVNAPPRYIRSLWAALIADNLNFGFRFRRDISEMKMLTGLNREGIPELRAATGPDYGRIWNTDLVDQMIGMFGDGVGGQWKHAGAKRGGSTIFGSDRDVWMFLTDEENKIDAGDGSKISRGIAVSNSEVGSGSVYMAAFGFRDLCMNRTFFGISGLHETRIRHTVTAPDRWKDEVLPVLEAFSKAEPTGIAETIQNARQAKLDKDADEFLVSRFGATIDWAKEVQAIHEAEEGRPIETIWDVVNGVTAKARAIPHQDRRVALERQAGKLLDLVAVPA